jgi:peptide/nickel transport system substrate-binding protein
VKKYQISMKEAEKTHPAIPEAYDKLVQGRISRRDFLRLSTLLGLSAGAAQFLAACGAPAEEAPVVEEEAPAEPAAPAEEEAPTSGIKRGGTWDELHAAPTFGSSCPPFVGGGCQHCSSNL